MHAPGGEHRPGARPGATPDRGDDAPDATASPDVMEALRQIGDAGKSGLQAASDASKAFRTLLFADISLARSAIGRALAFTGVAVAFGASAWLLLMATLIIVATQQLHLPWAVALLLGALLSAAVTGYAAWRAMSYFEHTRLRTVRRQLARLGIGELADYTPDAGSPQSARDATEALADQVEKAPIKDDQGIDVTPP